MRAVRTTLMAALLIAVTCVSWTAHAQSIFDRKPANAKRQSSQQDVPPYISALRDQIAECWNPPAGKSTAGKFTISVQLDPHGELQSVPQAPPAAAMHDRAMIESAVRAIRRCAPYNLPSENYASGADVSVTFDPAEFIVSPTASRQTPVDPGVASEAVAKVAIVELSEIERSFTQGNSYTPEQLARMDRIVVDARANDTTPDKSASRRVGMFADKMKEADRDRQEKFRIAGPAGIEPPAVDREDFTKLTMYYSFYKIAKYCYDNEAGFTGKDVDAVQREIKRISDSSSFSQQQKDSAWRLTDTTFENLKAQFTYQSCVADRQQMNYTLPNAFVSGSGAANPF